MNAIHRMVGSENFVLFSFIQKWADGKRNRVKARLTYLVLHQGGSNISIIPDGI
jgi:hypothetical protein